MKCSIMLHFIGVFTVCKRTCSGISWIQRVNDCLAKPGFIIFWKQCRFRLGNFWKTSWSRLVLFSPRFFKKAKGMLKLPPVCPTDRLSVMLSPPKPMDKIQPNLVCELLTWMGRATSNLFLAPPPGDGSKGQISFNFNYKVNFKDFYTKLCVCSHKWKIQNISDGIFILLPGSCLSGGTFGRWGCPGGKKNIFFKHGHVAYKINGDDKQNRMQIKFSS